MRCIIFAHLKPGQTQILSGRRRVWGRLVYVSALRLDDGELLIVVSSNSSQTSIDDYAKRWGIETLFGMLREQSSPVVVRRRSARTRYTREFCLESTHFTDSQRLSKLLAHDLSIRSALCVGQLKQENGYTSLDRLESKNTED